MKRLIALASLVLALACGAPAPAVAQLDNAKTAPDCNSTTYPSGVTRQLVQTTAGLLCSSATASGTFVQATAGTTGSAPPSSADYQGVNVAGTLRGQTGKNPTGTVFAADVNIASTTGYSFAHISTATTTTPKSGAGVLHNVCINNDGSTSATATVYDNTAGSGTVIAVIGADAAHYCYQYEIAFATGLTIVTVGSPVAPDLTVTYR